VVSSAIVDKYIGESARVIREMFGYAREHQPCVIFMDEIDAIGGRRFSEGTSADREIQRTLMELLSQLDGFDVVGKVGLVCVLRAVGKVGAVGWCAVWACCVGQCVVLAGWLQLLACILPAVPYSLFEPACCAVKVPGWRCVLGSVLCTLMELLSQLDGLT
jgi:hypothetical protein